MRGQAEHLLILFRVLAAAAVAFPNQKTAMDAVKNFGHLADLDALRKVIAVDRFVSLRVDGVPQNTGQSHVIPRLALGAVNALLSQSFGKGAQRCFRPDIFFKNVENSLCVFIGYQR